MLCTHRFQKQACIQMKTGCYREDQLQGYFEKIDKVSAEVLFRSNVLDKAASLGQNAWPCIVKQNLPNLYSGHPSIKPSYYVNTLFFSYSMCMLCGCLNFREVSMSVKVSCSQTRECNFTLQLRKVYIMAISVHLMGNVKNGLVVDLQDACPEGLLEIMKSKILIY